MTIPKNYFRIMLGRKSRHAETCRQGQFIGADYGIKEDLNHKLPEGVIIVLKDDMRRALKMIANIDFYRCQVSFKLLKD